MNPETGNFADFAASDFRTILKSDFERRQARNPGYSLRAFARDLGLQPCNLSDVLNRRCGLSRASAQRISNVLGHSKEQTVIFSDLVESHHARSRAVREAAQKRLAQKAQAKTRPLTEDLIRLFTDWKVLAVLQMVVVLGGSIDAESIATKLNFELREVSAAIDLLRKYELIKITDNRAEKTDLFIRLESSLPSTRIRNFHKQIAELTISRIDEQPVSTRKNLATVFPFDGRRAQEARQFINDMHDRFLKQFATDDSLDSVYVFSQNFLRLDSPT